MPLLVGDYTDGEKTSLWVILSEFLASSWLMSGHWSAPTNCSLFRVARVGRGPPLLCRGLDEWVATRPILQRLESFAISYKPDSPQETNEPRV